MTSILNILVNDLWIYLITEWLESLSTFIALDIALCNRYLRAKFYNEILMNITTFHANVFKPLQTESASNRLCEQICSRATNITITDVFVPLFSMETILKSIACCQCLNITKTNQFFVPTVSVADFIHPLMEIHLTSISMKRDLWIDLFRGLVATCPKVTAVHITAQKGPKLSDIVFLLHRLSLKSLTFCFNEMWLLTDDQMLMLPSVQSSCPTLQQLSIIGSAFTSETLNSRLYIINLHFLFQLLLSLNHIKTLEMSYFHLQFFLYSFAHPIQASIRQSFHDVITTAWTNLDMIKFDRMLIEEEGWNLIAAVCGKTLQGLDFRGLTIFQSYNATIWSAVHTLYLDCLDIYPVEHITSLLHHFPSIRHLMLTVRIQQDFSDEWKVLLSSTSLLETMKIVFVSVDSSTAPWLQPLVTYLGNNTFQQNHLKVLQITEPDHDHHQDENTTRMTPYLSLMDANFPYPCLTELILYSLHLDLNSLRRILLNCPVLERIQITFGDHYSLPLCEFTDFVVVANNLISMHFEASIIIITKEWLTEVCRRCKRLQSCFLFGDIKPLSVMEVKELRDTFRYRISPFIVFPTELGLSMAPVSP